MQWDNIEQYIETPEEAQKFIKHNIKFYDVLKIRSGSDYQYFFVYDIRKGRLYGYEAYKDPITEHWRARMPDVLIFSPTELVGKNLQVVQR